MFINKTFIIKPIKLFRKILFPILGIASLIWFLIRVIPKPSRASYPCIRASFPIASSFVIWLLGFISSWTAFRLAKKRLSENRYLVAGFFFVVFIVGGITALYQSSPSVVAKMMNDSDFVPNQPMGDAQGIYPGRVVWVHNSDATNENSTMSVNHDGVIDDNDDVYYLAKNNNESVIDQMVNDAILELTGAESYVAAWDSLFRFHNRKTKNEDVAYTPGEKIMIKTNNQGVGLTFSYNSSLVQSDGNIWGSYPPHMTATSPYPVLSVLKQLVNEAGISQENIYVGDPHISFNSVYYNILSAEFPEVHILSVNELWVNDCEAYGRTLSVPGKEDVIFYSDRGTVLTASSDKLYQSLIDADYLINIPALKGHIRAGITLFCKSHFGSHTRGSADHLHNGLVSPGGSPANAGYGKYRVLVDLMAHEHLGGKTMLYLLDGLWGGNPHELREPRKYQMAPFNNDWTSSIFVSMDPVAIASVAFDILRTEYNVEDWADEAYPNIEGVDDYLHQAADSTNWPENIQYDPENDGTVIASLGVHEHWNNATDMQYSRNLEIGEGIELIKIMENSSSVEEPSQVQKNNNFQLDDNYPNPFNNGTMISYTLETDSKVILNIYDVIGKKVRTLTNENQSSGAHLVHWDGKDQNANSVASGMYVYRLSVENNGKTMMSESKRMLMVK